MSTSTGLGLNGKVAIITGSTSGIGRGCAVAFAKEGCFVTVTGRNAQDLEDVTKECIEAGLPKGKVLPLQGDLMDDSHCERLISSTVAHFGHLDILINNAGIFFKEDIENTSMEDHDRLMRINTHAPFLLTKLAIPHLTKTKGNIVNVSSAASQKAGAKTISYTMSKGAIDHLTRTASLEFADRGVRVNSINPGVVVDTNIAEREGKYTHEQAQKFYEGVKNITPLKRMGEIEEIANGVLFLASNQKASFLTGVNLPVCGGYSIA